MSDSLTFKTAMSFDYDEPKVIAPGITRVVANNGGPLTFNGTNTYLVGTTSLAVIDPGPDDPDHTQAILTAARGRPITHILLTHRHRDHVDGIYRLKSETKAKTYAFDGTRSPRGMVQIGPLKNDFIDLAFTPDQELKDGDLVEGDGWALRAVHTPGHAPDHLCFSLEENKVLFSGDHVMAWNTSVIAPPEGHMANYLVALEKLLARDEQLYLPGHGGRIDKPSRTVRAYLLHRRWREQAILEAIRGGTNTINSLVSAIYKSVDKSVVGAASLSVLAHVELLHERGLVLCEPQLCRDARIFPA